MLAVDGIHAGYQSGIDILQDLSLAAEAQKLTLIIGPNGAGKSTLLRTIFGFLLRIGAASPSRAIASRRSRLTR